MSLILALFTDGDVLNILTVNDCSALSHLSLKHIQIRNLMWAFNQYHSIIREFTLKFKCPRIASIRFVSVQGLC